MDILSQLTPAQLADLRAVWGVFDRDGGGFITTREIIDAGKVFDIVISAEEAHRMLHAIDTDADVGRLDFMEFLALVAIPLTVSMTLEEQARSLFDTLSPIGGRISLVALHSLLRRSGNPAKIDDLKLLVGRVSRGARPAVSFGSSLQDQSGMLSDDRIDFPTFLGMVTHGVNTAT
jgi:Ca2+-binding EF-hand superfamily protein